MSSTNFKLYQNKFLKIYKNSLTNLKIYDLFVSVLINLKIHSYIHMEKITKVQFYQDAVEKRLQFVQSVWFKSETENSKLEQIKDALKNFKSQDVSIRPIVKKNSQGIERHYKDQNGNDKVSYLKVDKLATCFIHENAYIIKSYDSACDSGCFVIYVV